MKFLLSVVFNFKDYSERPALPPVRSSASARATITAKNGKRPSQKMINYRIRLLEARELKKFPTPKHVLTRSIVYGVTKLEKGGSA